MYIAAYRPCVWIANYFDNVLGGWIFDKVLHAQFFVSWPSAQLIFSVVMHPITVIICFIQKSVLSKKPFKNCCATTLGGPRDNYRKIFIIQWKIAIFPVIIGRLNFEY